MCRINGIWSSPLPNGNPEYANSDIGHQLRDQQSYGGPDDAGHFHDKVEGLYLGHRRLSIIGPGSSGHQPMENDRFVLLFNGAIYNYQELRKNFPDYNFHSDTDSEVILACWTRYGMACLPMFRGMFVIVLWDKYKKQLTFVRDRMGVKPLYYYLKDGLLIFGSEMKAILNHPKVDNTINPHAVSLFLQQGYIPAPDSILKYAKKLPPGHIGVINKDKSVRIESYWSSIDQYKQSDVKEQSENQWISETEAFLTESFNLRMVADVPVGLFLSGGIDSSLLTALLQKDRTDPLDTFTIGFEDPRHNEAGHAHEVSSYLGTRHHEYILTIKDFENTLPDLPFLLDEPMGDASIIPTHMVAKKSAQEVKVVLSADGGDELFGGYTKYEVAKNYYGNLSRIPFLLRQGISRILPMFPIHLLERFKNQIPLLKEYQNIEPKLLKFGNAIEARDLIDFFNRSSSFLSNNEARDLSSVFAERISPDLYLEHSKERLVTYLSLLDINTYLSADILTKVDRATMHASIEGREPFLDHQLFEYSLTIPDNYKIVRKENKYLLRQILYKYIPRKIIDRPKQGFSIPIDTWLTTLLQEEIENMKKDRHFIEYTGISRDALLQHINNFIQSRKNPTLIWYFYVLYKWYTTWIDR